MGAIASAVLACGQDDKSNNPSTAGSSGSLEPAPISMPDPALDPAGNPLHPVPSQGEKIPVTGVAVCPTAATVNIGASTSLTANVAPENASSKTVSWVSGNTGIATVDSSGMVTGVAAGAVTITATTKDGKTASAAITVDNAPVPRTQWYTDDRVGIIVHWGLYSIPAGVWGGQNIEWYGEWIKNRANISDADYRQLASQFNPTQFDANQWIASIKAAGFKYFCLVTKHHDGFALWDTQQNDDWNVMDATPFHRDIVGELAQACTSNDVHYALYYSSGLDWHYPSSNWAAYKPYYYRQLRELLTNYGKIGYLWFDGEWVGEWNNGEAEELRSYVLSIDPKIVTNNTKQKSSSAFGDFGIDEKNYTPSGDDWYKTGLWERDRLVQENTWGYKSWENWKTPKALILDMIDAASKNMNYCLNIGPKADGTFPRQAMDILAEFGKWLVPNGEAIYKTNGFVANFATNVTALATRKTDSSAYYLHVTDWTQNAMIITTALDITQATSLGPTIDIGTPSISRSDGTTTITINKPSSLDPYATVLKLVTRDEQEKRKACEPQSAAGSKSSG